MTTSWHDSKFIALFKVIFREHGFKRKAYRCSVSGELQVFVGLRNRWGAPIPDIYCEIYCPHFGELFQGDMWFICPRLQEVRAEFSDAELLIMSPYTEARIRDVLENDVIPTAIALTRYDEFFRQLDSSQYFSSGARIHPLAKLRQMLEQDK